MDFRGKSDKIDKQPGHRRSLALVLVCWLSLLIIFGLAIGAALAYQAAYKDKVYPGIYAGAYHLGGLSQTQVKDFIESFNNRLVKEGLDFKFTDKDKVEHTFKINVISGNDGSMELIKLESWQLASSASQFGRTGVFWRDLWQPFYYRFFRQQTIKAKVKIEDEFMANLKNYLAKFHDQPTDAKLTIKSVNPLAYDLVDEKSGTIFKYQPAAQDIIDSLSQLSLQTITIYSQPFSSQVTKKDIQSIINKLPTVMSYGNFGLNYIDAKTKVRKDWTVTPDIYREWVEVTRNKDNELVFGLNQTEVFKYLKGLQTYMEQPALDAKFEMDNDKVKKFQASQSGIRLEVNKTFEQLDKAWQERNYKVSEITKSVSVLVDIVEPKVKMAEANNLGIKEILGIGVSTFKDSHTNRIKNIANAAARLNGTLIRPGEIFSTNKYAGPYTQESGYLEEEVIVGNEIKKEVGGGMCQIGTTMFRMAMNSGLPIKERRNHSLVVQYYADPINGNPGTDATVYEPYVDFKFVNDTGNYLLLETSIDYVKQVLSFILWGQSDGRKGSYSHPTVSKWYSAGEPIETKVVSLSPGEKKCQNAFIGAQASFTYTRFTSTSEKVEQVFESYYRPLPKICMVGVSQAEFCSANASSAECKNYSDASATST